MNGQLIKTMTQLRGQKAQKRETIKGQQMATLVKSNVTIVNDVKNHTQVF